MLQHNNDNDIKYLGSNYINLMKDTNSFKYFNHYHCYVEANNIYFRKQYINSMHKLHKMDNLEDIYKCLKINNKKFVHYWMESDSMNRYSEIKFMPKSCNDKKILNLFTGFKYENYKKKKDYDENNIIHFKNHLNYICDGNDKIVNHIIHYIAHIIQKPFRKTECVIVLYSCVEGIGKNSFCDLLNKIFENYVGEIKNIDTIENKFNSDLACKLLVIGDEIKGKAHGVADQLKNLITQKKIRIEYKGKEPVLLDDYTNYIFTTNNEFIFKITENDRRYMLIECPLIKKDKKYFDDYYEKINDDEYVTDIFYYLNNLDLSNYDPREIPLNDYKKRNILMNLPAYIQMIRQNYDDFCEHRYSIKELYPVAVEYAKKNKLVYSFSIKMMALDYKKFFGNFSKIIHNTNNYYFPKDFEDIDEHIMSVL